MANQLAPKLTGESRRPADDDSSTNALIGRYRPERGRS